MPTPSEQKALAFVAIVVLLAGAARVVRAGALAPPTPTPAEQQALARQLFATDSAATSHHAAKAGKSQKRHKVARIRRYDVAQNVGGVEGVHPGSPLPSTGGVAPPVPTASAGPIDLDTASPTEIETLPRIGPTLARRIVANRDSAGPFGSLERLRRVKGIGPATVRTLAPLVTFSGQTRR